MIDRCPEFLFWTRIRLQNTQYCSMDRKSKTVLHHFDVDHMVNVLKNDSESQFEAVLY